MGKQYEQPSVKVYDLGLNGSLMIEIGQGSTSDNWGKESLLEEEFDEEDVDAEHSVWNQ